MEQYGNEWTRKGATLSDKTARAEFGLTQDEIIAAIRAGKLQYRNAATEGTPWPRLLRREVEELVSARHGERYLREQQTQTELKRVNRELRQLRTQIKALEERRTVLLSELAEPG
jgi:flagellar motility protein MotE (MotC chaperone)